MVHLAPSLTRRISPAACPKVLDSAKREMDPVEMGNVLVEGKQ